MLDERVDRDDEKTAGKSEQSQQRQDLQKAQSMQRQHAAEDGHAHAAERNQPIFDLPTGKITGGEAAYPDADGQSSLQVAATRFVKVQDFAAVKNDNELKQRTEEPEVGVADDRQLQCAVGAHQAPLRSNIAKNVPAEFLTGIAGGHTRDEKTGKEPEESERTKNHAGECFSSVKRLRQVGAEDGTGNDGEERGQFQHAIAPGKFFPGQKLRQQAVFRQTKKRSLRAGQENHGERQIWIAAPKRENGKQHGGKFENFGGNCDVALAEAVGRVAAGHREQQKRNGEKIANQENSKIFLRFRWVLTEDQKNDEKFQAVVVERALELRNDEAPETDAPAAAAFGLAWLHSQPLPRAYLAARCHGWCGNRLCRL